MERFNKCHIILSMLLLVACVATSVSEIPAQRGETPEDIVNRWLLLAKEQKWDEMTKIAQLTWVNKKGSKAAEEISWKYDFFEISSWRIISTSRTSDTFYTITVEVQTQLGTKTMKANVIREIAPYQPSKNGKWGVNPVSAMLK